MEIEDRISQLPQHILQNHILSLLPQEVAVRTCVLSKSWRHLGLTRPKFEFCESYFNGRKQEFLPVVENTLQRYNDQNLSIQEFDLEMSGFYSESIFFLNEWIPIVIMTMGVKTFNLKTNGFSLPFVFQAEFLEELFLKGCITLSQIGKVQVLHRLRTLSLRFVHIEEETFEKIMSICPSIEHLVMYQCKRIYDSPPFEAIFIKKNCEDWFRLHNNYFFPRLKSLKLQEVHLTTEWLNNLSSSNCPCLQELELHDWSGCTELKLSNRSIKRLIINITNRPIKPAINIDAANILYFEFEGCYLPSIISFAITSREWLSRIHVWLSGADALSAWSLKLHDFLKVLSQSQISLHISYIKVRNQDTNDGGSCEPVVIEDLCFRTQYSSSELPVLFNCLFRICRPRYIVMSLSPFPLIFSERELAESIWKTLVNKGKTRQCDVWQQDLEESSIQVSDKNANEWHAVQVYEISNNEEIRFRLKWRDLS